MDTLQVAFGLRVGYSDHTEGIDIPIAAVARGATIIEKHFTLDRSLPGPDHRASLEPQELAAMIKAVRNVERALGHGRKIATPAEQKNRTIVRKSLVAARSIRQGDVLTSENLGVKRPGSGISPLHYWEWLGKIADRDYPQDSLVGQ
ncbi:N,N'-diacetyllegionaminic acid synthase [compost metagenome]